MNELKLGSIINYVAIIVRLATSFLVTPFVIASLGVEEYGLFILSSTILSWISLTDLGLGGTVNKYVATYYARHESEKEAHFLGQSIILFSLLGLLTFVAGMVCYACLDAIFPDLSPAQMDTLEILYLLTLGNLILAFPLKPIGCVPGAHLKFIIPGLVNLALSVLHTVLNVLLLIWGYKAIGLTVMGVAFGVAGLLWGLYYVICSMGVRIAFHRLDFRLYREMFSFSFWMMLNQLMDLFYWRTGAPVLARFSTMEAVTVYSLGSMFAVYFMTASSAISQVITPKVMHMVAQNASKEELTHTMVRVGRFQAFILSIVLLGFAALGLDFLQLWVGETMQENVWIVWGGALMIILPLFIPLTQNSGLPILQALNIHHGRAIILFYTSLICVVSGAILSWQYGSWGMFAGTAISLIIGQCILINIYYHKRAGLNMFTFIRNTYCPLLIPLTLAALIGTGLSRLFTPSNWLEFTISASSYGCLCSIIMWRLYFKQQEREIISIPIYNAFKRLIHLQ